MGSHPQRLDSGLFNSFAGLIRDPAANSSSTGLGDQLVWSGGLNSHTNAANIGSYFGDSLDVLNTPAVSMDDRHRLEGSTITSEASNVYGLSPNAPSFQPSSVITGSVGLKPTFTGGGSSGISNTTATVPGSAGILDNVENSAVSTGKLVSIISLTSNCLVLEPSQVKAVKLIANIFGDWSPSSAVSLRRSIANPALWGVTIQLPVRDIPTFQYKYIAVDDLQRSWLESDTLHGLTAPTQDLLSQLSTKAGQGDVLSDLVEQEDTFRSADICSI